MSRRVPHFVLILLTALALLGCAGSPSAQQAGLYRVTLVTEGSHTFAAGEVVAGDLIVLGGHVRLADGAIVDGSLIVLSGVVDVEGSLDGDAYLVNGSLTLGPTALVGGDVSHTGGALDLATGAKVGGTVSQAGESTLAGLRDRPGPTPGDVLARTAVLAALLVPLALGFAAVFGQPTSRVGVAMVEHPLVALALGLLALIVVPTLLVLMAFTLVLAPVAALLAFLLGATLVYGLVGLGGTIGRWIGRRLHSRRLATRQVLSAPLGTAVLVLGLAALSFVPLLEVLAVVVTLSLSLGSVLMTGYGSRPFVPASERLAEER